MLLATLERRSGLTEYELLKELAGVEPFFASPGDNLALFRQHFLLFHCLYRLQAELQQAESASLNLSPLSITLRPYQPGEGRQLSHPDPLRSYYLDISHLYATSPADVEDLLGQFWSRLAERDTRSEALKILGLCDPIDDESIKQRYRRLVMAHHPDRGGDVARLQLINAAMADLGASSR